MIDFTPRQLVEQFHLLFLDQLGQNLDKRLYALKGGCNLRFFYNSIRYSEDIDLDITTIAKSTLTNKITKILDSRPFKQILKVRGMEIDQFTAPKQTNTTQRWKVALKTMSSPIPLPTKIEFSRRGIDDHIKLGTIDKKLTQKYNLHPIFIPHYHSETALHQKIQALLSRTETQARDVFDIHLLLQNISSPEPIVDVLNKSKRQSAVNNALSVSFEQYKSQVLSYLEPKYQLQYSDPAILEQMQLVIVELLS